MQLKRLLLKMSLNIKTISAIKREKYSIVIKSTDIPPSFSFRWAGRILIRYSSAIRYSLTCIDFRRLSKLSSSGMGRFVDFLYIFRKTDI